jgi:hypothetical protein
MFRADKKRVAMDILLAKFVEFFNYLNQYKTTAVPHPISSKTIEPNQN